MAFRAICTGGGCQNLARFDAAGGEVRYQAGVGGEKIVLGEFAREDPGNAFEGQREDVRLEDGRGEEGDDQGFAVVRVAMCNLGYGDCADKRYVKFLAKFAG